MNPKVRRWISYPETTWCWLTIPLSVREFQANFTHCIDHEYFRNNEGLYETTKTAVSIAIAMSLIEKSERRENITYNYS